MKIFTNERVQIEAGTVRSDEDAECAEILIQKFANPQEPIAEGTTRITTTKTFAEANKGPPIKLTIGKSSLLKI